MAERIQQDKFEASLSKLKKLAMLDSNARAEHHDIFQNLISAQLENLNKYFTSAWDSWTIKDIEDMVDIRADIRRSAVSISRSSTRIWLDIILRRKIQSLVNLKAHQLDLDPFEVLQRLFAIEANLRKYNLSDDFWEKFAEVKKHKVQYLAECMTFPDNDLDDVPTTSGGFLSAKPVALGEKSKLSSNIERTVPEPAGLSNCLIKTRNDALEDANDNNKDLTVLYTMIESLRGVVKDKDAKIAGLDNLNSQLKAELQETTDTLRHIEESIHVHTSKSAAVRSEEEDQASSIRIFTPDSDTEPDTKYQY